MRKVLAPLVSIALCSSVLWAAMSDSKAATQAFKIWGPAAVTARFHPFTHTNETKQIGYLSPGCQSDFTIVAQGDNTWDAAFAALPADMGIGGTFSGRASLSVQSPGESVPPAITSDPTPGIVTSVQILLDNAPLGPPLQTGVTDQSPWSVTAPWDTTVVPDGFHVMCAQLIHPDGSYAKSRAVMLIVKQSQP